MDSKWTILHSIKTGSSDYFFSIWGRLKGTDRKECFRCLKCFRLWSQEAEKTTLQRSDSEFHDRERLLALLSIFKTTSSQRRKSSLNGTEWRKGFFPRPDVWKSAPIWQTLLFKEPTDSSQTEPTRAQERKGDEVFDAGCCLSVSDTQKQLSDPTANNQFQPIFCIHLIS